LTYYPEFGPKVLSLDESQEIMREFNQVIQEKIESMDMDDSQQLALAAYFVRLGTSMYRGVISTEEILDLLNYVGENLHSVREISPRKRKIN
jgi:hypothetical protein